MTGLAVIGYPGSSWRLGAPAGSKPTCSDFYAAVADALALALTGLVAL